MSETTITKSIEAVVENESVSAQPNETLSFDEAALNKVTINPLYFGNIGVNQEHLLGWAHQCKTRKQQDTCVVLCAPLGLEYMNTYRSLRYMADYLALAGFTAMRFDYHGTGDSCGFNLQENRLEDWLASIKCACETAKALSGCEKVSLLGLTIGGTLAASVAEKLKVEHLVLWGTPDRGKRYLRELKALQMTSEIESSDLSDDRLEAGGMIYWPETENAIGQLNLQKIVPEANKVLLVERDDIPVMGKLQTKWQEHCNIDLIRPSGFSEMILNAHLSIVPHGAIKEITEWLIRNSEASEKQLPNIESLKLAGQFQQEVNVPLPENAPSNVMLTEGDFASNESFFHFGENSQHFGVITQPKNGCDQQLPKIVILNSGATHRVAPGRLYVLLARQLAKFGFQTYRIDLPGLGDSYINDRELERIEYPDNPAQKVEEILNSIEANNPNCKFIVMGLCSGAYHAFNFSLNTLRKNLVESILINPLVFYWNYQSRTAGASVRNFSEWNDFKLALTRASSWKKVLKFEINVFSKVLIVLKRLVIKLKSLLSKVKQKQGQDDQENLDRDLKNVLDKNIDMSFFFSREDPGYDLLVTSAPNSATKLIKNDQISVSFIEKADHTFSKFKPKHKVIELVVTHCYQRYVDKNTYNLNSEGD